MSDHGVRALVLAAVALVGGGLLLWLFAGRPSGIEPLAAAAAATPPGSVVDLAAVADEDWDALHVFGPYTPPAQVEEAVGERVPAIRGLTRDDVVLAVVTDDRGRVLASGLVVRTPVDWLPLAADSPHPLGPGQLRVRAGDDGLELHAEARVTTVFDTAAHPSAGEPEIRAPALTDGAPLAK